jgi:hypothetical protein
MSNGRVDVERMTHANYRRVCTLSYKVGNFDMTWTVFYIVPETFRHETRSTNHVPQQTRYAKSVVGKSVNETEYGLQLQAYA